MSDFDLTKSESETEVSPELAEWRFHLSRWAGPPPPRTIICARCHEPYRYMRSCNRKRYCAACIPLVQKERSKAISAVNKAIRQGVLKPAREHQCADCGTQARYYDHRRYDRPLEVDPVCPGCNAKRGQAVWANPNTDFFLPIDRVPLSVLTELSDAPDCAAVTLMVSA